jgi:AcrR family transcriptional regulator
MSDIPDKIESGEKPAHTPRGESQQQALVRAAYELIAEKGFEGLRTRDVAERAGVNIATLHYYFHSKEDLIRSVGDYLTREFRTVHAPGMETETLNPLELLQREFADARYQVHEAPQMYIVLFELLMRSLRDPAIKSVFELGAHWEEHIESYIAAGVRSGQFRQDLDISATAWMLVGSVVGYILQAALNPQEYPAERVAEQIERLLTDDSHAHTHTHAHPHPHEHKHEQTHDHSQSNE